MSMIDIFVEDDTPLMPGHFTEPNEQEIAIGKHCAALIEDGACMQMGIGAILMQCLHNLEDTKI